MLKRSGGGQWPKIVFTSDFHELVRGDLMAGACVLRYDPYRVVPEHEVPELPRTQRPITAYVRCHPGGELWHGDMRFPPAAWLVVDRDPSGRGTMLELDCPLPQGCDEIECWFSYTDGHGKVHWDSAMGSNYWLRFSSHDLHIRKAELSPDPGGALDVFHLEVDSVPAVDAITARWRYANAINDLRQECPLEATIVAERKHWALPGNGVPVAWDTPLAFDLVYKVGGHKHTDDNEGTWYVVSRD